MKNLAGNVSLKRKHSTLSKVRMKMHQYGGGAFIAIRVLEVKAQYILA